MAIRKIKSEQEVIARQKRMQFAVSIVMVGLLVMATVGYFAAEFLGDKSENKSNKVVYGGREFFIQNELISLKEGGHEYYFFDLPNKSRNIYLEESTLQDFVGKPLYVVNPRSEIQLLLNNLEGTYTRWQEACFNESCQENIPIKNCTENMIIFIESESEQSLVKKEENCILIYGDPIIGIDAISYKLLGIK